MRSADLPPDRGSERRSSLRSDAGRVHCNTRILIPILAAVLSGCSTTALMPLRDVESRTILLPANGPARTTAGGRTQNVGLPLPPAAKIGLWTGVAVLLALAMADEDDDVNDAGSSEP